MVKSFVTLGLLLSLGSQSQAGDSTIDQLDQLERQRVILEKRLEVTKLQKELSDTQGQSVASSIVPTENLQAASLNLIKIVGMASKPKAVFLYNGYRLTAERGEMVLPNVQLHNVSDTYVMLKDTTSGKESVVWLSTNQ